MNSATMPRPIALHTPWPVRWMRAVARWLLAPRPAPHTVRIQLSLRQLDDIGAPPDWRRDVAAEQRSAEIERAALRMQGMHAPLGRF